MEYETDITGYGRKMGLDARLTPEGRLDCVVKLGDGDFDGMQPAGTVQARTMNPGGSEVAGGAAIAGDYAPSYGREDGVTGNPRGPPNMNEL
jgi:hypothetical protein|tara:strand:- start:1110 stop:1385 length:276 start_codon:yes stop_codon:yes gene_type:complete